MQRPTSHVPDDFKPERHLDESYAKIMTTDASYLEVRKGESADFPYNNEAGIRLAQNTAVWASESPKREQCKIRNERDQQNVESPTVFICDTTVLDCHEKNELDTIANCKDVKSKPDKQNSTGIDSDGIKLELILDSCFEVAERKKSLLEINVMKVSECCVASKDSSIEVLKRSKETDYSLKNVDGEPEVIPLASENLFLQEKGPDYGVVHLNQPNGKTCNVKGAEDDFVCLQDSPSIAYPESLLAQNKFEDENITLQEVFCFTLLMILRLRKSLSSESGCYPCPSTARNLFDQNLLLRTSHFRNSIS